MHVTILSYGTRGDVQPMVAVAHALMARGHTVNLAAPLNHRRFVERTGVTWSPIAGDSEAILNSPEGKAWVSGGDVVSLMRAMVRTFEALAVEVEADIEAATVDADVIVSGALTSAMGKLFAEVRGVPFIIAHTFPALPSSSLHHAMVDLPFAAHLPGMVKKAASTMVSHAIFRALGHLDNGVRRRRHLPPSTIEPMLGQFRAGLPSLHLWSPSLLPCPADWPHEVVTGFCLLPRDAREGLGERAPLAELDAFVDDGAPPVFIGLGSMPLYDPAPTVAMMASVAAALDIRVILGGTFDDRAAVAAMLPPTMRLCGAVDHDALFPRCIGVLHHGGAGSTATSLRAGKPTMVCSVLGDQPFWGRLIEARGVGAFTPFRTLAAARLERGLRQLLDPEVQARAARLGEAMRAERDGAEVAAEAIERLSADQRAAPHGGRSAA